MILKILNRPTFSTLILALLSICLSITSNNAYAFDRMGTIGASFGTTNHNFELSGYESLNNSDNAFLIIIGWDVADRLSLEHAWFILGSYEFERLEPENDHLNYVDTSVSGWGLAALVYLVGSRGPDGIKSRRGLNLYAKLGASYFQGGSYSGDDDIFHNVTDGKRMTVGLGIEYTSSLTPFAIRGEVNTHNDDLLVGTLSLLWRWGRNF